MKLSDKIVSLEEYLRVELPNGNGVIGQNFHKKLSVPRLTFPYGTLRPVGDGSGSLNVQTVDWLPESLWWAHRELMRQQLGVYAARTSTLNNLVQHYGLHQYFPHISRDEPELIAFTMTPEDGIRDKQTRVALGRFVRKFFHLAVDQDIAKAESRHRSELNPTVKIIPWETEYDKCLSVYMTLTSCMGKGISSFQSDVHPLKTYCAPGWHLAVMYSDEEATQPSARGIVWINPANTDDKRWVRVYGDPSLESWLKRNNYAEKGFHCDNSGAYLYTHAIKKLNGSVSGNQRKVLAPYLDAGSNVHGGGRDEEDKNGYGLWDGENRIYLMSRVGSSKYPNMGCIQTTSGYLDMRPTPINVPCVISGEMVNAIKDATVADVYFNGKLGFALKTAYMQHNWKSVALYKDGTAMIVKATGETPTFKFGGTTYLDNTETRVNCGYKQLAAKYYPTEQEWVLKGEFVETEDGFIKPTDVVNMISASSAVRKFHSDRVALQPDFVRVASIDDVKTWAHPSLTVVTTTANRKVVPGVHPVTQMYDGTWAYTRHVRMVSMFGVRIAIPKEGDVTAMLGSLELPAPIVKSIENIVEASTRHDAAVRRVFYKHMSDRGDCYVPNEIDKDDVNWTYEFEAAEIKVGVIRKFLALPGDDARINGDTAGPSFHVNGNKLLKVLDERWAAKAIKTAETVPADIQPPLAV